MEKVDKNEAYNEKQLINKVTNAFKGTKLHKKIASCVTIAALMMALQSSMVMKHATTVFTLSTEIISELAQAKIHASVILDRDSYFSQNYNQNIADNEEKVALSLLQLKVNAPKKNDYPPMADNGVLIDGESDVAYYEGQEIKALTVIDTSIDNWEVLRDSVKEGEILLLDKESDFLDSLITKLDEIGTIDSLNIISHGSTGIIELASSDISIDTVLSDNEKWVTLGSYLSNEGDIQLFGCNIGQGEEGKTFVETLAKATNADVAASLNQTGAADKGGDWNLEVVQGEIEQQEVLTSLRNEFRGLLATTTLDFEYASYFGVYSFTYGGWEFSATSTMSTSHQLDLNYNNNFGDTVIMKKTTGSTFSLEGLYIGAMWYYMDSMYSLNVNFYGYRDGEKVATKGTELAGDLALIDFSTGNESGDFSNIDTLVIIEENGSSSNDGLIIDNIAVGDAITLTEVNNEPVTLIEGDTVNITTDDLNYDDGDGVDSGSSIVYTVKTAPSFGTLFVDANSDGAYDDSVDEVLMADSTFTVL